MKGVESLERKWVRMMEEVGGVMLHVAMHASLAYNQGIPAASSTSFRIVLCKKWSKIVQMNNGLMLGHP